ncbi:MAG: glycoside hydrolase family 3 protein [Chlorobiales bacterium]|jgi:beta-N-acetylhexosaminidase|nr:glycoside hydrolase family 3 protein [Chlorobiales bacterium]
MLAFRNFLPVILLLISLSATSLAKPIDPPDSLDIKIGQLLMVGFRGLQASDTSAIIRDIREHHIGGIILFDYDVPLRSPVRNIASPKQVKELTRSLQRAAHSPLFIAIDQEGGKVNRLKEKFGFPPSVSAAFIGKLNAIDSTRKYAELTAKTLSETGINLNFAPVVDVNTNPENPVIGKLERSYSEDPEIVSSHALATIRGFHQYGIFSAIKHFPGHGSAWNDSHAGLADVTETWNEKELRPFANVIHASEGSGCDMVMTAHIFNAKLDTALPATLSPKVIDGLLRGVLGFRGVVISDDMQMKAIRSYYGLETAIRFALEAGVDILLFANNSIFEPTIAAKVTAIIKNMISEGVISEERIDESYRRIMRLKTTMVLKQ